MKKSYIILSFLLAILFSVFCNASAQVDPILLDEPNENVFGCKNDIFIELTKAPTISKVASGRATSDFYILMQAEILFLIDVTWNGLDKSSFSLKWIDRDGNVSFFPLDYAVSMISNLKVSWYAFSEPFDFTDLRLTNLVFEVTPYSFEGWSLIFRPTERGAENAYCEIEIPLKVQ